MNGQGSIETLFVMTLIIILSLMVIGKFLSVQDNIFAAASARSAFIGEVEKLDKSYYLTKVEFRNFTKPQCPQDEARIVFFVNPNPINISSNTLDKNFGANESVQLKVKSFVASTTGLNGNQIQICYNNAALLDCQIPFKCP